MSEDTLPPYSSIRRWLSTTDHKDIGILYLVTALYFFVAAGILASLMRIQLFSPDNTFLVATAYNQAVTVHGLLMVLWFLSPFAFGFANYIVPLQIGARDLAFPRLNSMSYWLYLFSGILMLMSFFGGSAPDGGWTLYSPLTSSRYSPFLGLNLAAGGVVLLVVSVTVSSVNFIVTILHNRAPGMKLRHMPMFTWSILITVFMMLYSFPSLLAGVLMLFSDRALGTLYFSSNEGGAILWDHIFWFFGHPEVYIVLFPGIGAAADLLPAFTRRPLFGKRLILMSLVVAAVVSFMVWGHHMFLTGLNPTVAKLFTLTTVAVSLPFDVIVIAVIHSLVRSKLKLKAPALFAIGSVVLFIIGGITGVFLASLALDYHLRGTYWVVSHFHYVMVGGSVMALFGALYYWFPKITGKMYHEGLAKVHFLVSFIGFNLLYFPMYLLLDMPRRVFTYGADTGWGPWNSVIGLGGMIFGLAQLLMFANLFRSLRSGAPAGPNPWNASSLEWSTSSPPPENSFEHIPIISSQGAIQYANESKTEQVSKQDEIGKSDNDHPRSLPHESHLSYWPLIMAVGAFTSFLGVATILPILFLGVALVFVSIFGYAKERFIVHDESQTEKWPFGGVPKLKLGVWAFLASEVIFFSVLMSAYLFVRMNSGAWPAVGTVFSIDHGATNTFILLTSSFTAVLALSAAKAGSRKGLLSGLVVTLGLGLVFLFNKGLEWAELFQHGFTFGSGLPSTAYFITTGAHGFHVAAGIIILFYLIARAARGWYVKGDHHAVEHFGLYWHLVDIIWVFLFPLFYLM